MLNCREITELSSDYLDGCYHGRKKLQIRLHLMICRHCRRFQRHLSHTRDLSRRIATRLWGQDEHAANQVLTRLQQTDPSRPVEPGPRSDQKPPDIG